MSLLCTGQQNEALGADAKVKSNGECSHPNKTLKSSWTHCVFCWSGNCVYAGECEYKKKYKNVEVPKNG